MVKLELIVHCALEQMQKSLVGMIDVELQSLRAVLEALSTYMSAPGKCPLT